MFLGEIEKEQGGGGISIESDVSLSPISGVGGGGANKRKVGGDIS